MKKIFSNMMLMATLLTGAVITSCNNSEEEIVNTDEPAVMTYHMVVNAAKGRGTVTRALSGGEGSALVAEWAVGEEVYVYNDTKAALLGGCLKAKNAGASATLEGDLTGTIEIGDELVFMYPKKVIDYTGQDGTLAKISSNYDYALTRAHVSSISGSDINLDAILTFDNMQAIVRFSLVDNATGNPINATSLTIDATDGSNSQLLQAYTYGDFASASFGPITITYSPGTNVFYTALSLFAVDSYKYILTATNGTDTYTYEKDDITFEPGYYYEVTVKMKKK
ncbi:MAG: hypothetical protein J5869_00465 [Bacteroidaceae bacterium]|nr:hypothetical protein [Bacteroidaceae bacterium]